MAGLFLFICLILDFSLGLCFYDIGSTRYYHKNQVIFRSETNNKIDYYRIDEKISYRSTPTRLFVTLPRNDNKDTSVLEIGKEEVSLIDATISDFADLVILANQQFGPSANSLTNLILLNIEIFKLFIPKLLLPDLMQHQVICLKSTTTKRLVGFVDLSLQTNSGSIAALTPRTMEQRKIKYGKMLDPYLCNLLISERYRKRGLGRKLVLACEERALLMGSQVINLHVETTSTPALSLYISSGFVPIKTNTDTTSNIIFMRKKLNVARNQVPKV